MRALANNIIPRSDSRYRIHRIIVAAGIPSRWPGIATLPQRKRPGLVEKFDYEYSGTVLVTLQGSFRSESDEPLAGLAGCAGQFDEDRR